MPDRRSWDLGGGDREFNTAGNWSGDTVPVSGDDALFPPLVSSYTPDVAGGDMSAIALVNLIVQAGCHLKFAARDDYLKVDADYLRFEGDGKAFFEVVNSTELLILGGRSTDSGGDRGMNLIGSSNALLVVNAGGSGRTVGVGAFAGETAAFTEIRCLSGEVELGDAVTVSTVTVLGGSLVTHSGAAGGGSMTCRRGGLLTIAQGSPVTLTVGAGGRVLHNEPDLSNTTIVIEDGGVWDLSGDPRGKTFSTTVIQRYPGGRIVDPYNLLADQAMTLKGGGTI